MERLQHFMHGQGFLSAYADHVFERHIPCNRQHRSRNVRQSISKAKVVGDQQRIEEEPRCLRSSRDRRRFRQSFGETWPFLCSKKLILPDDIRIRCIDWSSGNDLMACGGDDGFLQACPQKIQPITVSARFLSVRFCDLPCAKETTRHFR